LKLLALGNFLREWASDSHYLQQNLQVREKFMKNEICATSYTDFI